MFTKHRGHSTRRVTTEDGGWSIVCSCGKVLARYPGWKELSNG